MPSSKSLIAATVAAALTGAGAATLLDVGAGAPAGTAATAAPAAPLVRTQVVTRTIHRVRRVHVRRPAAPVQAPVPPTQVAAAPPAPPAPAAAPVAAPPPAPAAVAPVRTRSSGAGAPRREDAEEFEGSEREDD